MSFLATAAGLSVGEAALLGGGLAATGAIGSSLIGANAAGNAADTQANAANRAADQQMQMFQQTQQNLAPWMKGGQQGYQALLQQLGIGSGGQFDPNAPLVRRFSQQDIMQDPGYLFAQQQGQKAILNRASAGGGIWGGNTGKALADYVTGLAGQQATNAFSRFNIGQTNEYNRLAGISDTGVNAAGGIGRLGAAAAQSAGNFGTDAASAQAAGMMGQANAFSRGLGSLTNIGSDWLQANALQQRGGPGGWLQGPTQSWEQMNSSWLPGTY